MARKSRELAQRPAVDPQDEPSAEWGWHGTLPLSSTVAGIATIVILILFTLGDYQSRLQDYWLFGIAALIAFALVLQAASKRNSWRR